MDPTKTALERAFELARSGGFATIRDIKQQLQADGYSTAQITGRQLMGQLRDLMKASSTTAP